MRERPENIGKKTGGEMKNLEAKFRLPDLAHAEAAAFALGYTRRAILLQRDTFFRVANGKLKMRQENGAAVLIFYRRHETGTLMLSDYEIVPVAEPERTRTVLADSLGVLAIVEKERILMTRDNVRFHLDRVAHLGDYGEIEAVIADGESPERSRAAVDRLLAALGIATSDLIDVSYFELLA